jgi:hypothetical protein
MEVTLQEWCEAALHWCVGDDDRGIIAKNKNS